LKREVTCIGGGLAGSELALQLSSRGIRVTLIEMRPVGRTPAHHTQYLAELVCSNSLKSDNPLTASGLFKKELRMLGCKLIPLAEQARVPAGHALAVDRKAFASKVTESIESDSFITLERREQRNIDLPPCSIVATGPLTSPALSQAIENHFSRRHLYFYDAVSISVDASTIDEDLAYRASRYGKGGDDYWNIPLTKEEYERLVEFLLDAPKQEKHDFEETKCFESCLPAEVTAARGKDALRYGPLKPVGLPHPRSGRVPYAVIQLRQETKDGSMLGLVGFQTRLKRQAQRDLLALIPALHRAEIVRWGSIHRNTFLDSPRLLDTSQMSRKRNGLYFSGQIIGVEGYVESIAHGLLTAQNIARSIEGRPPVLYPSETIVGSLQRYVAEGGTPFQPMNANFGLLPPVSGRKKDRKRLMVDRSMTRLRQYIEAQL
jgi:methylenetetrahydrofolate--tRNA-(uracil-5-)-methyltransferase